MEQFAFITGFFCLGPLALVAFGFWLGKGAPGFPWKLTRRDGYGDEEIEDRNPYQRESHYAG